MSDFVHLHCHTDYSMLDGAAKIDKLVAEVAALGQKAVAITDHGNMHGAYKLWEECKKFDIKPIFGIEAYLTPGTSRYDRNRIHWSTPSANGKYSPDDISANGVYTHMTLFAENNVGLSNLISASSRASLEGQWGKYARMDREILNAHAKGLIATTGCPSGEVQTRIKLGQMDEALKAAGEFQDIFGKDNFFVELMNHGIEIEARSRDALLEISKKLGAPLLATNDLHYVKESDATAQDAMLAINSGNVLVNPKRFKFDGTGYYVKSAAQMYDLFKDLPEACENTLRIAERCTATFSEDRNLMPVFPTPDGQTDVDCLKNQVFEGLKKRFPAGIPVNVVEQTKYELEVIVNMGYSSYFLIVADFINWAKSQGIIIGPGRGSAAGSMLSYALGITELDPMKHGLIFERFLNPERESKPDIDVDIEERRRQEVIDYVSDKYGEDTVSQIITFNIIKARNALRDSARILGWTYSVGDELAKAVPPDVQGRGVKLTEIFDETSQRYNEGEFFRELVLKTSTDAGGKPKVNPRLFYDPEGNESMRDDLVNFKDVYSLAAKIEGLIRNWGVHASGVIMSSKTIQETIPIMRREKDGAIITQFEFHDCESLGLVKMDFLGLKNLNVLGDALANIKKSTGENIVLETLPLDDKATYKMVGEGNTLGVFQLDSPNMRALLRRINTDKFNDIVACIALYRPGPMGMNSHNNYADIKNNRSKRVSIHPELDEPLKEILDETYGLVVYQEQVQRAAQKLAGYTLGAADELRRAMGKKKKDVLDKQFIPFSQGMKENGFSADAIKKLWDTLLPFADYAFNKAHAAAYGLIAYWTAYLKTHYPDEFMAALLSNEENPNKLGTYINECNRMKIPVLLPDVNESDYAFKPVDGVIRFGLGAIKGVGGEVIRQIVETRAAKGAYTSFTDFINKVPLPVVNRRVLESLIKAGAFDSIEKSRNAIFMIFEDAAKEVMDTKHKELEGQYDLFSGSYDAAPAVSYQISVPDLPEWDKNRKLEFEREMLGFYVSEHPLEQDKEKLAEITQTKIVDILEYFQDDSDEISEDEKQLDQSTQKLDQEKVVLAGRLQEVETKISKKGNAYANLIFEDLTGSINMSVFGKRYQENVTALKEGAVVKVNGRISLDHRTRSVSVSVESITPLIF
ncbi:MAG: DNA polymerase III subunit alpha [Bifidobacteriaceae bacterium]|jgi:DNA polymerase-3 subunit alpha|nr:DNA polymerase III subunit alpha [Bifidobacteriaceae bacterium]